MQKPKSLNPIKFKIICVCVCVKLWFTTMFLLALIPRQIWLYFVQSFPCMFVGFNVRVECESLVKNCENSEIHNLLMIGLQVDNSRN